MTGRTARPSFLFLAVATGLSLAACGQGGETGQASGGTPPADEAEAAINGVDDQGRPLDATQAAEADPSLRPGAAGSAQTPAAPPPAGAPPANP